MSPKNRAIAWGVLAWVLIGIAVVWMRGVQWDETYEHAQVITGQVAYPDGHPLLRYCHTAYSVQTTLSVLMLKAGLGPMAVCGLRNLLVLLASVLPVFLLTTSLTHRALWGHVAAVFTLAGIYLTFDGSYPLMVWPSLYSNGHIGGGVALIILYLLVAGHTRAGFLMTGLMPAIHAGEAPPVLGIAALMLAWLWYHGKKKAAVQGLIFGFIGIVLTAAFFFAAGSNSLPAPTSGPYYSTSDPHAVWAGYTALHDIHRRFPPTNGHIVLIGTLILAAAAAWQERTILRPYAWLLIYTAGIAAAVWGIMAVHEHMGADIPFALIGWMPYRLINHIPPIALSIIIATLVRRQAPLAILGALIFLILTPAYGRLHQDIAHRYLTDGQAIAFTLYAIALGSILISGRTKFPWVALMLPLILAPFHQFGAACLVAGLVFAYILSRLPYPRIPRYALIALMLLLGAVLLIPQWYNRRHLPIDSFSRQVADYLKEHEQRDALLVYPPDAFLPQAKTGHPILAENSTPSLISYAPNIGPGIEKIYNDIYGITFMAPTNVHSVAPTNSFVGVKTWQDLWQSRTQAQWTALANEYNFNYIIVPSNIALDLIPILTDSGNTLYHVN